MTTRRAIKGALNGFLGKFTSRYSNYQGYWLFGFVVKNLNELKFSLIEPRIDDDTNPEIKVLIEKAVSCFRDQILKTGLKPTDLREASLRITRPTTPRIGYFNGHPVPGFDIKLEVFAQSDNGQEYRQGCSLFVAPHDPKNEYRCEVS